MKNTNLFIIVVLAIFTWGCNKDNDQVKKEIFTLNHNNIQGRITSGQQVILDSSKEYKLTNALIVEDGATLTIPAGTTIKATGGPSCYIAVAQGGKIYINGSDNNPVIMTSGKQNPDSGDWGGLVVCGKAPTNLGGSNGQTATSEVASLTYGGNEVADSSGSIRYLRVEYAGVPISDSKEFNGISFFGVGNGTTVEYIQAYETGDDGIEFYGGTVNANYLVSINSGDDGIDFADGWQGNGQYWYVSGSSKAAIEGSNNSKNPEAQPITATTLKNITVVKGSGSGTEGGIYIKEGGGEWTISDVYIKGLSVGVYIKSLNDDPFGNEQVKNDKITFEKVEFDNVSDEHNFKGNKNFITKGQTLGAGNEAALPEWAENWTKK